jgi:xanthine dehydrogenase small subunit
MSHTIKFMLNDQLREVSGLSPVTTVLQYLRMHENLTGTKEGCAEGDCGACTVMLGDVVDGAMRYRAINACIVFLPTLDGRHLVTVEHLKSIDGQLNPVQQAMVDCNGSQCGFCTPGFVMSLATLQQNNPKADRDAVQDAIAGNLCRCTGYRPILEAADKALQCEKPTFKNVTEHINALKRDEMFSYEGEGGKFYAPVSVKELCTVLAQNPKATLLAGGTDIGLWVTKMHIPLPIIIYTANVRELQVIEKTRAGLEIGAAVTYADAFTHLAAYDESFHELLRRLGSNQIRSSGTLGGNIANGSPIGDGMPPLIALGAKIVLRSSGGTRQIDLEDYFIAYKKQDRKEGEFVERIIVPDLSKSTLFKTYKISKRFDQDISAVCGAFSVTLNDGKIAGARIVYGGMAGTPLRGTHMESYLNGKPWTEETLRGAMALLPQDFTPMSDMRASAEYRNQVAQNLLYRFFLETTQGQEQQRVYGYGA